ncbi:hypothetical protein [Campylobacter concisus]|uniref:hypothetical protein n=1 Tax=Campylobacter concisus TaxID=199 RepID=UPI0015E18A49|nr:hypothetical protein [Campylobacter concisus]
MLFIDSYALFLAASMCVSACISLSFSPSIALAQLYLPNQIGLASGVMLGLSITMVAYSQQSLARSLTSLA